MFPSHGSVLKTEQGMRQRGGRPSWQTEILSHWLASPVATVAGQRARKPPGHVKWVAGAHESPAASRLMGEISLDSRWSPGGRWCHR